MTPLKKHQLARESLSLENSSNAVTRKERLTGGFPSSGPFSSMQEQLASMSLPQVCVVEKIVNKRLGIFMVDDFFA